MKIQKNIPPTPLPPVQQSPLRGARTQESGAAAPVPAAPTDQAPASSGEAAASRSDRVEISDEARSRAARADGEHPTEAAPARERSLDEIRQRIHDGVYETDHALDSIARRILERGDI